MNKLRWVSAVCLCAFCSTAPTASAQGDVLPSFTDTLSSGVLRALYITTPVVQAIDGISTLKVIQLGGKELNPMMAPFVSSPGVFAATRAALAFGQIYMAHELAKRNRFLAIGALAGLNVAYAMIAVHNYRVADTLQNQPRMGRAL